MVERGPYVSYANCGLPYHVSGVIAEESSLLVATAQVKAVQGDGTVVHSYPFAGSVSGNIGYGDVKHVWELNRHQHFVTLGQAYWYTGDEAFARAEPFLFRPGDRVTFHAVSRDEFERAVLGRGKVDGGSHGVNAAW